MLLWQPNFEKQAKIALTSVIHCVSKTCCNTFCNNFISC